MSTPMPIVYIAEVVPAPRGPRSPAFLPVVGELFASIQQMIARAVQGVTEGDLPAIRPGCPASS